jgi:molybdenum-dependent DNA-binding transcriptional regulator ModE
MAAHCIDAHLRNKRPRRKLILQETRRIVMDQLFCMRVFARVVEHGSFARAAEDLEIAPPTATGALAQLEKHLGVRLLHRTTRRL